MNQDALIRNIVKKLDSLLQGDEPDLAKMRKVATEGVDILLDICLVGMNALARERKISPENVGIQTQIMMITEAFVKFYPDIESMRDWIANQDSLKYIERRVEALSERN